MKRKLVLVSSFTLSQLHLLIPSHTLWHPLLLSDPVVSSPLHPFHLCPTAKSFILLPSLSPSHFFIALLL